MTHDRRDIIDACVFQNVANEDEVLEYVSPGWREYLMEEARMARRSRRGFTFLQFARAHYSPLGETVPDATSSDGTPGSDIAFTAQRHVHANGISRAVLWHDVAMELPAFMNYHLAVDITRALNEWFFERFLPQDGPFLGTILAQTQDPVRGAEEIRRFGTDPRCVAVMVAANGLGKPFGHPLYHPIYAAAAEMELPVVIGSGGDMSISVMTTPTAGGSSSTYIDERTMASQPLMTHLASLIGQGVFDFFPDLKVMLVGGGVGWIPAYIARLEGSYRQYRRDTPWLKRAPTEYFLQNIRVGTYPLDRTDVPERLARYLNVQPGIEDVLCYASGYPKWDRDTPADIEEWLPAEWHEKVLVENPRDFFRLPERRVVGAMTTVSEV